jgi:ADP-ribose pyrophosphatase YjhB (NUDIX family)
MKFCSNCGSQVSQKIPDADNRPRFVCDHCSTIHYQNPRVIAGILPIYNEQILLCKRAIEPRCGFWTLPAGFLENGESTLEGAQRECIEEANAEVCNPTLYALYDIPRINQVYVFFRAELVNTNFGPSTESTEVKLFDAVDIPWAELAFPVVQMVLDQYLYDRERGEYEVIHEDIRGPWQGRRH